MSNRDDMVLRPTATGPTGEPSKVNQQVRGARAAAARNSKVGAHVRRRLEVSAARKAVGASSGRGMMRAVASPPALIAGALIVGALVATSLLTGRTTENMGNQLESLLLGGMGPEVRARKATREMLQANDAVSMLAANGITKQMRQLGDRLYRLNLKEEEGKALIMRDKDFQTRNMLDMMIEAFRRKFAGKMESSGAKAQAQYARAAYRTYTARSVRTLDDL